MLAAIFTGYPRWKLREENLPQDRIKTFPWLRTLIMGKGRLGPISTWLDSTWLDRELNWLAALSLDAYAAAALPACDVFIGLSGGGLKTGRLVQSRGGRYICDRGSTHIRFTAKILDDEFKRWGQVFPEIDPRAVAREEMEYSAADAITVPSNFCLRSFVEMGLPRQKMRQIPYGVELGFFRKVSDPPSDRFEVLFVGQVSFRKGVPYLLEAFRTLKCPRKRLRVVGGIQKEMKVFLKDRQFENVEFLGSMPQRELIPVMSTSHVMVLPSVEDGMGLVLGQAMACGCPVICSTNTGGEDLLPESLQDFVVPIRSPAAIRERLEWLCGDNSLREKASWEASQRVKTLNGWDDYGNQFAALCKNLAGASDACCQGTTPDSRSALEFISQ
jgi:glycosyltransferase involved in cell wall biosynthesis